MKTDPFNAALRKLMASPPKSQDDVKEGRKPKPKDQKSTNKD